MNFLRKYKKPVIKIAVSTVLFGLILWKVDRQALIKSIGLLNLNYVPLIIFLFISNYVISSVRWKILIIHENREKVTVSYLISLYFIGSFFNNFMPTSIGGDVFKIYKLGKKVDSGANALSATFMERFTGVIALVLISLVAAIKFLGIWGVLLFVGFWFAALIGLYSLKFLSKKINALAKVYDSLVKYRYERKVLFWAFITSFIVQLIAIFTQFFVFKAIGANLPITYSIFVFPLITLASFFIPSLNGVGVQDLMYMELFSAIGIKREIALSASILYHLFRLAVSLIGGLLYAAGKSD